MAKSTRILNDYRVLYRPEHESSMTSDNWKGYVYEHIYIMECSLGRSLHDDEVVHHLDCNRANNRLGNLLLTTRAMHAKIHQWIDDGSPIHESYSPSTLRTSTNQTSGNTYCEVCDLTLQDSQLYTCSPKCSSTRRENSREIAKPSKEQLSQDMADMSWVAMGKKYEVSDNAVRKWAKKYDLL